MIRILTDSSADFRPDEAARLGLEVVPLTVTFEDGSVYRDGLDLTPDEFYAMLSTCHKLPTTSQPSPESFLPHFEEAREAGDVTIAILISSELSGTLQSARIAAAAAEYHDLLLVDSRCATLALKLLVYLALELRDAGHSPGEIVAALEEAREQVRLVAVVDDLKYFRKGGRLPAAAAFAGAVMGIKPVVTLKDGKVGLAGKARGMAGAYVAMFKLMEEQGGLDPERPYLVGYTGTRHSADPIQRYLTSHLGLPPAPEPTHIGTVVGTHAGPGAAGICFFAKRSV